jgi:rare lipoprotein A
MLILSISMRILSKLIPAVLVAGSLIAFPNKADARCGEASYYGPGLYGNLTASGEVFRPGTMTAAHPYLPLGSWVRVTNQRNGRSVSVRINDRGPYAGGRIIDLSKAAAARLGMLASGVADVCISRQ